MMSALFSICLLRFHRLSGLVRVSFSIFVFEVFLFHYDIPVGVNFCLSVLPMQEFSCYFLFKFLLLLGIVDLQCLNFCCTAK